MEGHLPLVGGPVPGLPAPGRTLVLAVLNVTPDSFSDGGAFLDPAAGIAHGLALVAEGADLVDVGGESTRPGAPRVDPDQEWRRIGPVIAELSGAGVPVSVDTMHALTARRAVAAGARLVNDVSGGLADPGMLPAVAELGVPYVCMHWRGHAEQMAERAHYADVVAEVRTELVARLDEAAAAGVDPDRVILDPGLGFAKTAAHNWALLARLDALASLGRPLLVGASRKSFLGALLAEGDTPRPAVERDDASVALTALLAWAGVWGVRTHTARPHRDAVEVAARLAADQSTEHAAGDFPRLG